MDLASLKCVPCRGGGPPLPEDERARLLGELGGDWEVEAGHHLTKTYRFDDFALALDFVNRVGAIAEE